MDMKKVFAILIGFGLIGILVFASGLALSVDLIENTDQCLVECSATYLVCHDSKVAVLESDDYSFNFKDAQSELVGDVSHDIDFYQVSDDGNRKCYWLELDGTKKPNENVDHVLTVKGVSFPEYAWWNSSWQYKRNVTVANAYSTACTGCGVNISLTSNFTEMQPDCDDIRVLDVDEDTELEFQLVRCNVADVHIYMKNTFAGFQNVTYFVYFGNPDAGASGDQVTFTFDNETDAQIGASDAGEFTIINKGNYTHGPIPVANITFGGVDVTSSIKNISQETGAGGVGHNWYAQIFQAQATDITEVAFSVWSYYPNKNTKLNISICGVNGSHFPDCSTYITSKEATFADSLTWHNISIQYSGLTVGANYSIVVKSYNATGILWGSYTPNTDYTPGLAFYNETGASVDYPITSGWYHKEYPNDWKFIIYHNDTRQTTNPKIMNVDTGTSSSYTGTIADGNNATAATSNLTLQAGENDFVIDVSSSATVSTWVAFQHILASSLFDGYVETPTTIAYVYPNETITQLSDLKLLVYGMDATYTCNWTFGADNGVYNYTSSTFSVTNASGTYAELPQNIPNGDHVLTVSCYPNRENPDYVLSVTHVTYNLPITGGLDADQNATLYSINNRNSETNLTLNDFGLNAITHRQQIYDRQIDEMANTNTSRDDIQQNTTIQAGNNIINLTAQSGAHTDAVQQNTTIQAGLHQINFTAQAGIDRQNVTVQAGLNKLELLANVTTQSLLNLNNRTIAAGVSLINVTTQSLWNVNNFTISAGNRLINITTQSLLNLENRTIGAGADMINLTVQFGLANQTSHGWLSVMASDVWSVTTRTITSLTGLGGNIAADIWNYTINRNLTYYEPGVGLTAEQNATMYNINSRNSETNKTMNDFEINAIDQRTSINTTIESMNSTMINEMTFNVNETANLTMGFMGMVFSQDLTITESWS